MARPPAMPCPGPLVKSLAGLLLGLSACGAAVVALYQLMA